MKWILHTNLQSQLYASDEDDNTIFTARRYG